MEEKYTKSTSKEFRIDIFIYGVRWPAATMALGPLQCLVIGAPRYFITVAGSPMRLYISSRYLAAPVSA
jgi:hypothetical protein